MKTIAWRLTKVLPFAIVFMFSLRFPKNTDLGWHLKQGEYFVENFKIMDTNVYSSQMPGFNYINYSWLSDIFGYLIFHHFSFWGLSIITAAIITIAFYLFTKAANFNTWQKSLTLPLILLANNYIEVSYRELFISSALFGGALYLLSIIQKNPKRIIVLYSILMAAWVNLHGQFVFGIVLVLIWILTKIITDIINRTRFNILDYKYLLTLFLCSIIATLINPYYHRIYFFVFEHFNNKGIQSRIIEWMSPIAASDLFLWTYVSTLILYSLAIGTLYYKKKIKENLLFVILPIPFLLQSFSSSRYLLMTVFTLIPIIGIAVDFLKPIKKTRQRVIALSLLILFYGYTLYFFPLNHFLRPDWQTYCLLLSCPSPAIQHVLNSNVNNLYTDYDYGGWLIWNHPEVKPSTDGRMTTWTDQNGYSAFIEYYDISRNAINIDKTSYNAVLTPKDVPLYKNLQNLAKKGSWKLEYEDLYTAFFIRL